MSPSASSARTTARAASSAGSSSRGGAPSRSDRSSPSVRPAAWPTASWAYRSNAESQCVATARIAISRIHKRAARVALATA
jgi:hypothetical protein